MCIAILTLRLSTEELHDSEFLCKLEKVWEYIRIEQTGGTGADDDKVVRGKKNFRGSIDRPRFWIHHLMLKVKQSGDQCREKPRQTASRRAQYPRNHTFYAHDFLLPITRCSEMWIDPTATNYLWLVIHLRRIKNRLSRVKIKRSWETLEDLFLKSMQRSPEISWDLLRSNKIFHDLTGSTYTPEDLKRSIYSPKDLFRPYPIFPSNILQDQ